ncbi:CCCH zinc finger protein [Seminavis robusta]|uniref:CCCH zinc finger protein n=1 Tax=Seminavis robusta TaxID=568900 RepID=A0A9N8EAY3_9STRA|nr:CCCH zinc finger protein [Seminavis robusta]|eukprot:Sro692_g188030.1 CCCH zinc finger protein (426) ;mRNA; r:17768-19045
MMRYSRGGRGRGGRGRFGRGGEGRNNTARGSMAWVRPPSDESSGVSNGPVLRGPGHFRGRGRGRSSSSSFHSMTTNTKKSWRRDASATSQVVEGSTVHVGQENSSFDAEEKPKIVVARDGSSKKEEEEPQEKQDISSGGLVAENVSSALVKLGSNKLVVSNKSNSQGPSAAKLQEEAEITHVSTTASDTASPKETRKMMPKGSNKLVLSKNPSNSTCSSNNHHSKSWNKYSAKEGDHLQEAKKTKRTRSTAYSHGPTVKRVKIYDTMSEAYQDDNSDAATANNSEQQGKSLTNAAYRETYGGNRLVRVNQEDTPICQTFLRGIKCENERCTKRHDVPRESAMPICSFFQRHGQCLKGSECRFRHVKVNPLATICPSFNLLGYCDDEACPMKHVAATKKVTANGKRNSYHHNRGSNNKQRTSKSYR